MATGAQQRQEKEVPTQPFFFARDLGLKSWKLSFVRDFNDTPWVQENVGGDRETLLKTLTHVKRHFHLPATTVVHSCEESGRNGFWLHRIFG